MSKNHSLPLAEIAAWQITHPPARTGSVVAALPSLQRGAVWKVKQIEELWDSILRRFPIGAFVISPIDTKRGLQPYKHQQDDLPAPTYHLLDGQQRATGIALGFFDVWRSDVKPEDVKNVCWIDLGAPPESRDVAFLFRLVTRAHPWGYSHTDPDERLSEHKIRSALKAFQAANSQQHRESRPEDFPLTLTWPWDSEAPVPLPVLIAAVCEHKGDLLAAKKAAWARIEKLPLFASPSFPEQKPEDGENKSVAAGKAQLAKQSGNVRAAFQDADSQYANQLTMVLQHLSKIIDEASDYRVPLLHLDMNDAQGEVKPEAVDAAAQDANVNQSEKKDPVELLFVRINSAGTPLAGEELIYSLLKSAWIDAPKFIEKLKHKPALPSRIAMLCIRIVLARRQLAAPPQREGKTRHTLPAAPSVDEFRRLVRNLNPAHPDFFQTLQDFIQSDAAKRFEDAWIFLTEKEKSYTLPPVLAVELAQKAPDVFFLLLRWLDKLRSIGIDIASLEKRHHQRTLGFLTALAWFSPDKTKAVAAVWDALQAELVGEKLKIFFNKTRFSDACRLDERYNLRMIPLPTADELDLLCKKYVTGYQGCQGTISRPDSEIWKSWDWNSSLADKMAEEMKAFYAQKLHLKTPANADDDFDLSVPILSSCQRFFDTIWESRSILLYGQRHWLTKWFPRFDPSLPEYMEDKNRPWDYDHIHPQNYTRSDGNNALRGIPQVIWDWHGSIGNLRAWPLEANRADGDTSPAIKLTVISDEEKRYSMSSVKDKRTASFVQDEDWLWWEKSIPEDKNRHYLKSSEYHDARHALIMAIVTRFTALYRGWYDSLKLNELQ